MQRLVFLQRTLFFSSSFYSSFFKQSHACCTARLNIVFARNYIWKSTYDELPAATQPFQKTMIEAIEGHMKNDPERLALVNVETPSQKVTYSELHNQIHAAASYFHNKGLKKGDVICALLPNSIEYVVCLLGALKVGAVVSGASSQLTAEEIKRQIVDCQAKMVVTERELIPKILEVKPNCPKMKEIVITDRGRKVSDDVPDGINKWEDLLLTPTISLPENDSFSPSDLALLPYSSGTTGATKGVLMSHQNIGTTIEFISRYLCDYLLPRVLPWNAELKSDKMNICHILPFYHCYGAGLFLMALKQGMTGYVLPSFNPQLFLSTLQDQKIKFVMVVPPILLFLAKHPMVSQFELPHLKLLFSGAAPLGHELVDEIRKRFPSIHLCQGYGMTEVGIASHFPTGEEDDYTNCGALGATFTAKILSTKTGEELGPNKIGELCLKGPCVTSGYFRNEKATKEAFTEDGWLKTGDIVTMNERGQAIVVDRIKELIKVKGHQVPPAELEDILLGHDDIVDAAVIGVPNQRTGEVPMAFVVRTNENLSEREVQRFVEDKVSDYKYLDGGVRFVDEIPKSAAGKILRKILRAQIMD